MLMQYASFSLLEIVETLPSVPEGHLEMVGDEEQVARYKNEPDKTWVGDF